MNANVQRLATNSKSAKTLVVPPVTPLPSDVLKRFPSLAGWQAAEEQRRANFQTLLNDSLLALAKE
jgi:hypothetical protein